MSYAGTLGQVSEATQVGVSLGEKLVNLAFGGGNPRSGGADPCCPRGYNPPSPWPVNSRVDGAPPDYRTKGSPLTDPSPSGVGRKKDDFCDCVPFQYNGKRWMVGSVSGGKAYAGLPSSNRDQAVWVVVDTAGRVVEVPGFGSVTNTVAPSSSSTGPSPTIPTSVATAGVSSTKLAVAVGAAMALGLYLRSRG